MARWGAGRTVLAVVTVVVVGASIGVVGARVAAGDAAAELVVAVDRLPPAPVGGTTDASAVWTGSEFIVFGGGHGDKVDNTLSAAGVAYDPDRRAWRTIAPSPLGQRARHVAVWTGREMLVWGGTARHHGVGDLVDGARYDPVTDRWRPMAPAPAGTDRSHGRAVVVGRTVVIGAGAGPTSNEQRQVLLYDLDRDRWQVVEVGFGVSQLVARDDGRVALAGVEESAVPGGRVDQQLEIAHLELLPDGSATVTAPRTSLPLDGTLAEHGGLIVHDGRLYVLVRGLNAPMQLWSVPDTGPLEHLGELGDAHDHLAGPVGWRLDGTAGPVTTVDGRPVVIPWQLSSLWGVDLDTLRIATAPAQLRTLCIAGAATATSRSQVFVWTDGSSCIRMGDNGAREDGFAGAAILDLAWPPAD